MKSSSKTRIRVLAVNPTISSRTARTFLEELANTWDDAPGLERFERKFREVYREQIPWETVNGWARIAEELDYDRLGDDEKLRKYWLMPLRDAVRTVWCLPDLGSQSCSRSPASSQSCFIRQSQDSIPSRCTTPEFSR